MTTIVMLMVLAAMPESHPATVSDWPTLPPLAATQDSPDHLQLRMALLRQKRDLVGLRVAPIVVTAIGFLTVGAAVVGEAAIPQCSNCEGVPGWTLLGVAGALVLSVGLVILIDDIVRFVILRRDLTRAISELGEQLRQLQGSSSSGNSSTRGVAIASF